jgi:hypothetical protein
VRIGTGRAGGRLSVASTFGGPEPVGAGPGWGQFPGTIATR